MYGNTPDNTIATSVVATSLATTGASPWLPLIVGGVAAVIGALLIVRRSILDRRVAAD